VLGDGENKYIVSVSGRGYCFAAPIVQSEEEASSPLAQVRASRINRAPQPTRLIGRAQSVIELCNLVRSHRIVSVVGSGGLGKSSIAIAAVSRIDPLFGDGCCFVDLGRVESPERVTDAVAVALGIPVRSVNSIDEIAPILQHRQMLIVIDGYEHVIEVAATLVEKIVAATASVHILATSREALRIEHERFFVLEPLAAPPVAKTLSAAEIMAYPAPQLMAEKTEATKGTISSDTDARLIAQICTKLDGLPLAIELAASQANVFGFDALAIGGARPTGQSRRAHRGGAARLGTGVKRTTRNLISEYQRPRTLALRWALAAPQTRPPSARTRFAHRRRRARTHSTFGRSSRCR
jgi:hypothetical protein